MIHMFKFLQAIFELLLSISFHCQAYGLLKIINLYDITACFFL